MEATHCGLSYSWLRWEDLWVPEMKTNNLQLKKNKQEVKGRVNAYENIVRKLQQLTVFT